MKQTINPKQARRIHTGELLEAKTIQEENSVITLLVILPQSTKTQIGGAIPRLHPAQRSQPHQFKEVCSETWPISIELAIQLLLPGESSKAAGSIPPARIIANVKACISSQIAPRQTEMENPDICGQQLGKRRAVQPLSPAHTLPSPNGTDN